MYVNIRSIREDSDITQQEMAKLLNVSQNTYSQYETGKIEWTASTLVKIADYFDVSIDYLLDRTKNRMLLK
ncbi:MAG: helix-turn-helix domain-containing protein [Carnobacterium sp.]|uniref:helix-turn-helix domain-containing protein n=2 Tax=Carnobacteriaceae TaxID=186828 RepID=UPI0028934CAA|nr:MULTISPECIES: helix-turn-helix transcriptional regulator [Carnobacterium]MDV8933723.1 helix-turn-helix domain-containing protein [Carnobacterium sp.]